MEKEEELDPIGPDFWMGQVLIVVAVFFGIWLTTRIGFTQAARFTQHEEFRQARNTLAVVRTELEDNLRAVKAAPARLLENSDGPIEISTSNLAAAATKPYMQIVDPALIAEIERLFTYPIPEYVHVMNTRRMGDEERKEAARLFQGIIDRTESFVLPL